MSPLHFLRRMGGSFGLFEKKFVEEQNPDHVEPADDDTGGDRDQNADDEPENAALAEERRPPYQKFHDVVNDGNEEENNLNQLIPFVKPIIDRAISL